MEIRISIIILTLNAGRTFGALLKEIYASNSPSPFEVLVIDSSSSDSTRTIAARYPVRLFTIERSQFHHGATRNYGASQARGDILVFLTQDAIPADEQWLGNLVSPLKERNVAGVYGKQIPYDTNIFESFFLSQVYPDHKIIKTIPDKKSPLRLQDFFFSNVNSAIKREVWEKFKFDERIIMSEDQEWSRRVLLNGYSIVYEPEAAVYHSHNYELARTFKRNFDSGFSLRGLIDDKFLTSANNLLRYIYGELKYIIKKGRFLEIPRLLPYESFRVAGFLAGSHPNIFPLTLKRGFSMQPSYWR